jgi:hypothetical protein
MSISKLTGKDGRKDIHLWTPIHEVVAELKQVLCVKG